MPIKFRCNYCRQFLGISRAQAGGIVDCPTCGRSIRVPQLDGSLQPLPEPELNLQDAHLARALEELARLGLSDSQPVPASAEAGDDLEEAENEIPQPIPEPIPIEVPIPPTPIAVNPPLQEDDDGPAPASRVLSGDRPAAPPRHHDLLAELASLTPPPVDSQPNASPAVPPDPRRPAPARTSIPQAALLIAIAFVAGMLFERFLRVVESLNSPATAPVAVPNEEAPVADTQVTGRITYKSADGASQPDRGARMIAFPLQREGEARLPVVGFRPADGDVDAKVAAAALQALGGGLATADESGQYRLNVPAGTYQLLILSHFQSRTDQEPVDPALQKLLQAYFDKPDELLGRIQFDFGPLRVKGTGDVRDHSF